MQEGNHYGEIEALKHLDKLFDTYKNVFVKFILRFISCMNIGKANLFWLLVSIQIYHDES